MRWIRSQHGRLHLAAARFGVAGFAATGALLLSAMPAHATIEGAGDCTGTGYSTPRDAGKPADVKAASAAAKSGGTTVDFKSERDWYVPSYKDYLAGHGESPTGSMGSGFAKVAFFGLHFDVVGGDGHGTTGQGGPISAADLEIGPLKGKPVASILVGYGAATPDPNPPAGEKAAAGPCTGFIFVHFQDVSAAGSLIGEAGIILMIIGAAGTIATFVRGTK